MCASLRCHLDLDEASRQQLRARQVGEVHLAHGAEQPEALAEDAVLVAERTAGRNARVPLPLRLVEGPTLHGLRDRARQLTESPRPQMGPIVLDVLRVARHCVPQRTGSLPSVVSHDREDAATMVSSTPRRDDLVLVLHLDQLAEPVDAVPLDDATVPDFCESVALSQGGRHDLAELLVASVADHPDGVLVGAQVQVTEQGLVGPGRLLVANEVGGVQRVESVDLVREPPREVRVPGEETVSLSVQVDDLQVKIRREHDPLSRAETMKGNTMMPSELLVVAGELHDDPEAFDVEGARSISHGVDASAPTE